MREREGKAAVRRGEKAGVIQIPRRPAAVGLKKTEQNRAAGCWLFAKSQCLFYYYYYYYY